MPSSPSVTGGISLGLTSSSSSNYGLDFSYASASSQLSNLFAGDYRGTDSLYQSSMQSFATTPLSTDYSYANFGSANNFVNDGNVYSGFSGALSSNPFAFSNNELMGIFDQAYSNSSSKALNDASQNDSMKYWAAAPERNIGDIARQWERNVAQAGINVVENTVNGVLNIGNRMIGAISGTFTGQGVPEFKQITPHYELGHDFFADPDYKDHVYSIQQGIGFTASVGSIMLPAARMGAYAGTIRAAESTSGLSTIRLTQKGETFLRYESGNPAFSRVTSSGGLQPGTYVAPSGSGVQRQGLLNNLYNLPNPEIPRTTYFQISPPAGTPVIGPRPVVGGLGDEVIFINGAPSGSVGPALPTPTGR